MQLLDKSPGCKLCCLSPDIMQNRIEYNFYFLTMACIYGLSNLKTAARLPGRVFYERIEESLFIKPLLPDSPLRGVGGGSTFRIGGV